VKARRPSLKNVPEAHRQMVTFERYERNWFVRPTPGVALALGTRTTARAEVIRSTPKE